MSEFHKNFVQHIFQRFFDDDVEDGEIAGSHFDIEAFGEKMALAKSANIDALDYLQKCHDKEGKSVKDCLADFDQVVANLPAKK